jgi:hypothetical protein
MAMDGGNELLIEPAAVKTNCGDVQIGREDTQNYSKTSTIEEYYSSRSSSQEDHRWKIARGLST